ncbi:MAG: hypothetical protein WA432_00410 [Candidatus Babeliaceae bacterium]
MRYLKNFLRIYSCLIFFLGHGTYLDISYGPSFYGQFEPFTLYDWHDSLKEIRKREMAVLFARLEESYYEHSYNDAVLYFRNNTPSTPSPSEQPGGGDSHQRAQQAYKEQLENQQKLLLQEQEEARIREAERQACSNALWQKTYDFYNSPAVDFGMSNNQLPTQSVDNTSTPAPSDITVQSVNPKKTPKKKHKNYLGTKAGYSKKGIPEDPEKTYCTHISRQVIDQYNALKNLGATTNSIRQAKIDQALQTPYYFIKQTYHFKNTDKVNALLAECGADQSIFERQKVQSLQQVVNEEVVNLIDRALDLRKDYLHESIFHFTHLST